jgi:hypothetical protein
MHTHGAHYGAQAWRPTAHFAAVIAAGEKKAKCFFAVTEHYMDTLLLLLLLGSQGKSRNDQKSLCQFTVQLSVCFLLQSTHHILVHCELAGIAYKSSG